MRRAPLLAVLVLVLCASAPAMASAQDTPEGAMEHFQRGLRLYDAGDHEAALAALRLSFASYPSPNSHLYIARALSALGRLAEAVDALEGTLAEARRRVATDPRFRETVLAAADELAALEARVGRLVLSGTLPPSATITLGERRLTVADLGRPIAIEPGRVIVSVEAEGHAPVERAVDVSAGTTSAIELHLEPATGAEPSPAGATEPESGADVVGALGWAALGTGIAAVVAGSVLAVLAQLQADELERACGRFGCPPGHEGEVAAGRAYEISSWSLLASGAALAASGVIALLVDGAQPARSATEASTSIRIGILGVEGTF
jgi:tetratricopeptide (TPR) repeat protein